MDDEPLDPSAFFGCLMMIVMSGAAVAAAIYFIRWAISAPL